MLWAAAVPESLGGGATLATAGDVALVSSTGGLSALEARTGEQRWQADQALWLASGDAVLTSDRSDAGTAPTNLSALDAATGRSRWTAELPTGRSLAGLAADDQRAYATVVGADGQQEVVALSLIDGASAWTVPLGAGSDRVSVVEATAGTAIGSPADGGGIVAMDAGSGQERWRVGGWGLLQPGPGSTFAQDGNVYVQGADAVVGVARSGHRGDPLVEGAGRARWLDRRGGQRGEWRSPRRGRQRDGAARGGRRL